MALRNFFIFPLLFLALFADPKLIEANDYQTDWRFIKICNESSPVTMRTINEVLINKKLHQNRDENFNCFLHCLFERYGWMDQEGGFEVHTIHRMLRETGSITVATMQHVMFGCTNQESMDRCQRAVNFLQCFWRQTDQEQNVIKNETEDRLFYSVDGAMK